MVKCYLLPVETVNGTDLVQGIAIIHDALLLATEDADKRLLIMDTTGQEHDALSALALLVRDPTPEELELFFNTVVPYTPNPDTLRAQELLTTSPSTITMPEMWELLRIYARRFGILS